MSSYKKNLDLQKVQSHIASRVRELRKQRHWTQADLAKQLGISQSRLCEIENGAGSFTAEQFLLILQLFNVALSYFADNKLGKQDAVLQNALARLGAVHLRESLDVLPSEQFEKVADVIRETLIAAESPRYITALAPVLVGNIDHINLKRLYADFLKSGLEQRFAWLIENIVQAVRHELPGPLPRIWAQSSRRAEVVLSMFLEHLLAEYHMRLSSSHKPVPDILDSDIRSKKSLEEVTRTASDISKRWGVATCLQPEDFAEALRAVRANN